MLKHNHDRQNRIVKWEKDQFASQKRREKVWVCSVREGIYGIMMIPKEALDTQPDRRSTKADIIPRLCARI